MSAAAGIEKARSLGVAERDGGYRLGAREVHVWVIGLDSLEHRIQTFRESLSVDERARADRLAVVSDRERFVVGRFALRTILGWYCRVPTASVRFAYGPKGKPCLANGCRRHVHFNLSHSSDLAVLALCSEQPVGVDVEHLRRAPCGPGTGVRATAFLRHWTRTEALIKALGEDLSPLDLVADRETFAGWSVHHFAPADDYLAAIATWGPNWTIVSRTLSS